MKTFFAYVALLTLITACGCHKGFSSREAKERFVGTYNLAGKDCEAHGVKSSTLTLRSDGTYDQHVEFTSGDALDEVAQPWNYDGNVHFSNFRITATGDLHRYAPENGASLIVELSHPVVILLNPSSGCFYSQPK
jgi:hypothetical protein